MRPADNLDRVSCSPGLALMFQTRKGEDEREAFISAFGRSGASLPRVSGGPGCSSSKLQHTEHALSGTGPQEAGARAQTANLKGPLDMLGAKAEELWMRTNRCGFSSLLQRTSVPSLGN